MDAEDVDPRQFVIKCALLAVMRHDMMLISTVDYPFATNSIEIAAASK